jgi:hypothetical protein
MFDPYLVELAFLMNKSVQGSLFIMHHYLGVKRRKLGFFPTKSVWKTSKQHFLPTAMHGAHRAVAMAASCTGAHGSCLGAHGPVALVQIL